jgi:hypothetical protein
MAKKRKNTVTNVFMAIYPFLFMIENNLLALVPSSFDEQQKRIKVDIMAVLGL